MGKRIIQRARGHGGPVYRVRRKAFNYRISYPDSRIGGKAVVLKLISSAGHSAPLAKIKLGKIIFYNSASKGMYEGQEIEIGTNKETGNILKLKDIPIGTAVYNIEVTPGDGGKFVRSSGNSAVVSKKYSGIVSILMPSKKEVNFNENCRASIGIVAGAGRVDKPIIKAGKKYYMMKSKGKLWPRTSAVKMNVIDHPFGSGRGKNLTHGTKGKIAKKNAPAGARVGLIRPRRTGRRRGKG